MSWGAFAAIFAIFFLTHSIPVRPAVKAGLTHRVGTRGFTLGYSALSLAMLTLLIWSAGQAPYVQIWPQMPWQRHVTHLAMLMVCLILALSLGRPNPFSFGGAGNDRFDPARPGIIRWTRHPVLLALALWAGAHLLPNGDLAHVILFGTLGLFAIAGRMLIDRRKRRVLGAAHWHALLRTSRAAPRLQAPASWGVFTCRLGVGAVVFAALLRAHPYVIGVAAL
ncbi:NnrU family protein [Roseovarius sp. D0-M9]|uniref:NnrU family protein n=1 Tax=Roseovarius sp. D0-M9 TaxID=3127117 RepID=UPI00300FF46D